MTPGEQRSEERDIERIRKIRRAAQLRRDAKMRGVRFRSVSDWLDAGLRGDVDGTNLSDADVLIAANGAGLPSLGEYWTALLVINGGRTRGHIWVNAVDGAHALDKRRPRVAAGAGEIPNNLLDQAVALFDRHGLAGFASVPQRCYDGAPVSLMMCSRRDRHAFEVHANRSDDGDEPALVLVRTVWAIRDEIDLVEQP